MDRQGVTGEPDRGDRAQRRRSWLWIFGAVLVVYAGIIAATEGIDVTLAGVRIRSRTWQRPGILGLACLTVAGFVDRRRASVAVRLAAGATARGLDRAWLALSPRVIATLGAAWALVAGVVFSTYVAGGADSSGYLNQAKLFARGRLVDEFRMPVRPPWPELPFKLAPLGFRPSPDRQRLTPTYPPGYPLLMAPMFLAHERAAHLVVPLCGALMVWLAFALGRRLDEPGAGAAAALLVAVSPAFLYQLVQPMSDVPAAAAWLLALYAATVPRVSAAALAGVATGAAILIRPNLAPLAVLVCALCATTTRALPGRRMAIVVLAGAPAVVTLALIQSIRYGSPWSSGYGPMRDLFAWANIGPNLDRYPRWMFETHTPLVALFVVAPLWIARHRQHPRQPFLIVWLFAVAVVMAYVPYVSFQTWEWTYLRFLLPALPLMWLLTLVPFARALKRARPAIALLLAVPFVAGLMVFSLAVSRNRYVFELRAGERKYVRAAEYVRHVLPPNALVISMQHSGSLWFYTSYQIVRWDHVEPRGLDDALAWSRAHGYAPFMVVDREEFERMKQRFQSAAQRSLDRAAPLARFGDVTIYGFN
jgi:hypothetical protein